MFVGTGLHWYGLVKQSQALLASNLARDRQVRTGECPDWPRWRWLPGRFYRQQRRIQPLVMLAPTQSGSVLMSVLRIVSSFLIAAVRATFLSFPACSSR